MTWPWRLVVSSYFYGKRHEPQMVFCQSFSPVRIVVVNLILCNVTHMTHENCLFLRMVDTTLVLLLSKHFLLILGTNMCYDPVESCWGMANTIIKEQKHIPDEFVA